MSKKYSFFYNSIRNLKDQINVNHDDKDEVSNKNNQTTSDEIDTIQIDSDEYYYIYEIDKSYDSYFDNEDTNNVKKNKIKKRKTTIANIFTTKKTSIEEKVTEKEEEPSIQKPSEIKEDQQISNQNSKEDENVDGVNGIFLSFFMFLKDFKFQKICSKISLFFKCLKIEKNLILIYKIFFSSTVNAENS